MTRLNGGNKYHAKRTWSILCQREFDSRAEAMYGDNLFLMQKAGEISQLEFQHRFVLCEKPKVTITIDFRYVNHSDEGTHYWTYEDVKGVMTRDFRTKLAWLKEKHGIDVKIIKKGE
jgi:hypothetical protein